MVSNIWVRSNYLKTAIGVFDLRTCESYVKKHPGVLAVGRQSIDQFPFIETVKYSLVFGRSRSVFSKSDDVFPEL